MAGSQTAEDVPREGGDARQFRSKSTAEKATPTRFRRTIVHPMMGIQSRGAAYKVVVSAPALDEDARLGVTGQSFSEMKDRQWPARRQLKTSPAKAGMHASFEVRAQRKRQRLPGFAEQSCIP